MLFAADIAISFTVAPHPGEPAMAENKLQKKIIDYLQDAHAMEQNVLGLLDSLIATTKDPETLARFQQHRLETQRHEQRLRERLNALDKGTSLTAEVSAMAGAMLKTVSDTLRTDKPAKNARDAFITENTEIAAYELLERLAYRCGDSETARVARENRVDEEEMARWIAARWEKFVDLTLADAGFPLEQTVHVGR